MLKIFLCDDILLYKNIANKNKLNYNIRRFAKEYYE